MDAAVLLVSFGLLVVTGGTSAVAWHDAIVANRSESEVSSARAATVSAAGSAAAQASASERAAHEARRRASATEAALHQTADHRADERQAQPVLELTRMLYREVELSRSLDLWPERAFHRFMNGEPLIRSYTLLSSEMHIVPKWVANQRDTIMTLVDHAHGEIFENHGVGPKRAEAAKLATEAAQALLEWRRGDRSLASFSV